MADFSLGTFYDMNKAMLNTKQEGSGEYTFKPLTHVELAAAQQKIEDFLNWKCDSYAMLYCRERSDITIFHMYVKEKQNQNPPAVAASECIECCMDRGDIISIEEQEDGNYEIWIRINDDTYAYYLFPYDNAVIEV